MFNTKLKIYLETTLFNYCFLHDPSRQAEIDATKELFKQISQEYFHGFVSPETIREIENSPNKKKRNQMLNFIRQGNFQLLRPDDFLEFQKFVELYFKAGVVPKKKDADARHIAIASTSNMDVLASWNQRHIVRYKTQTIIQAINKEHNLPSLSVNTPAEIITYEEQNSNK